MSSWCFRSTDAGTAQQIVEAFPEDTAPAASDVPVPCALGTTHHLRVLPTPKGRSGEPQPSPRPATLLTNDRGFAEASRSEAPPTEGSEPGAVDAPATFHRGRSTKRPRRAQDTNRPFVHVIER